MKNGNMQSPAVYLLIGSEKYLKEKTIPDLRSSLLDPSSSELDYKVLHGADTSAEEIFASVSTIPFFSSKRLVVVRDFEKLSKDDTGRLINYIKNPNQYTCLVIDTLDGSILKDEPSLSGYAKVLKFFEPTETEASGSSTRSRGRSAAIAAACASVPTDACTPVCFRGGGQTSAHPCERESPSKR